MSHEWNCRCPRCLADEAKYTGPDPREQDEAARHAAGRGKRAKMPSYEITAHVSGLVCFDVTADTEDEARTVAVETWAMKVGDIQCCDLENLEVVLDAD